MTATRLLSGAAATPHPDPARMARLAKRIHVQAAALAPAHLALIRAAG